MKLLSQPDKSDTKTITAYGPGWIAFDGSHFSHSTSYSVRWATARLELPAASRIWAAERSIFSAPTDRIQDVYCDKRVIFDTSLYTCALSTSSLLAPLTGPASQRLDSAPGRPHGTISGSGVPRQYNILAGEVPQGACWQALLETAALTLLPYYFWHISKIVADDDRLQQVQRRDTFVRLAAKADRSQPAAVVPKTQCRPIITHVLTHRHRAQLGSGCHAMPLRAFPAARLPEMFCPKRPAIPTVPKLWFFAWLTPMAADETRPACSALRARQS
ncbi:hypothetical protein FQR65_LT20244 [Abscondita terminalis]|nr:hypothetical protein FQR65_LT20244 [Abscondita terminalis]